MRTSEGINFWELRNHVFRPLKRQCSLLATLQSCSSTMFAEQNQLLQHYLSMIEALPKGNPKLWAAVSTRQCSGLVFAFNLTVLNVRVVSEKAVFGTLLIHLPSVPDSIFLCCAQTWTLQRSKETQHVLRSHIYIEILV